jgi:hypothetical protein
VHVGGESKTVQSARTFPLCALSEQEKRGRRGEWATARRGRNRAAGDHSEQAHGRGRLSLERRAWMDRRTGGNGRVPGTGWRACHGRDSREREGPCGSGAERGVLVGRVGFSGRQIGFAGLAP